MVNISGRALFGCGGIAFVVLAVGLVAAPFTRHLIVGLVSGEPVGSDLRPLSEQIRRLSDPNPEVVDRAMREINVLGEKGAPAIPTLLDLARDSVQGERPIGKFHAVVRVWAITVIGEMRAAAVPAAPEVVPFLSHDDVNTRRAAITALQRIGPAGAADPAPLVRALSDSDEEVRRLVRLYLLWHAPGALKDEVRRLLAQDVPAPIRKDVCLWASDFGLESREFLPALRALLADPAVRGSAAFSIRIIETADEPNP
jgi:hypothetical protein